MSTNLFILAGAVGMLIPGGIATALYLLRRQRTGYAPTADDWPDLLVTATCLAMLAWFIAGVTIQNCS